MINIQSARPVLIITVLAPVSGVFSMAGAFTLLHLVVTPSLVQFGIAMAVGLCAMIGVVLTRRYVDGPMSFSSVRNVWTSSAIVMGVTGLFSQQISLGFGLEFSLLASVSAYSAISVIVYTFVVSNLGDGDDDS